MKIVHWNMIEGKRIGLDRVESVDPECLRKQRAEAIQQRRARMGQIPDGYQGEWWLDSHGTAGCGCDRLGDT